MALAIEALSLLVAEVIGLWLVMISLPDVRGAALAYVLGIALGGLGSRLAAMWRERASVKGSSGN